MTDKTAELPWTTDYYASPYEELGDSWMVDSAEGSVCTLDGPEDRRKADAQYIVKACNAYPELVKALEYARTAVAHANNVAKAEIEASGEPDESIFQAPLDAIEAALSTHRPPAPTCDDFVGGSTNSEPA